jgi:hypothetical protein
MGPMRELAEPLIDIAPVVAVTLAGSPAGGTAGAASGWRLGLYTAASSGPTTCARWASKARSWSRGSGGDSPTAAPG